MQTTLVTAPPFWTAGQMIDFLRDAPEEDLPESFFEIFVVDPAHRLLGNVFLDQLLRVNARRNSAICWNGSAPDDVNEDREDVARLFQRYNLRFSAGRRCGCSGSSASSPSTMSSMSSARKLTKRSRRSAASRPAEELSDYVWWTAKSRFLWLFVNLFTAFIASACSASSSSIAEDGGARGSCADRRESGRQCGDADHDRRRARFGDAEITSQHLAGHRPRGFRRRPERCNIRAHHGVSARCFGSASRASASSSPSRW